ncbi:hypothetical protein PRIPAC_86916 [Pristionchus pacificus]|nr:hypothetical protein PRIPAC_86916 [Pristionchus pacificus]
MHSRASIVRNTSAGLCCALASFKPIVITQSRANRASLDACCKRETMISKIFVTSCYTCIMLLSTFDGAAIDGIVPLIEKNFNINDAQTATIRTVSTIVNTTTLALIWIIGDYFERRKFFLSSVSLWIVLSLLSILLGSNTFGVFVTFRAFGSGAAAIFQVLVPVMVADLFQDRALGIALMLMTGSELISGNFISILNSWIVSSEMPWQTGLVSGPLLAIVPLVGVVFAKNTITRVEKSERKSIVKSLKGAMGLFSIKSFVLITTVSCLTLFHVRAFRFWFPTMILTAVTEFPDAFMGLTYTMVTTSFTILQLAGMLIGMPIILWFAQSWKDGTGPFAGGQIFARAFPIVASAGTLTGAVSYTATILLVIKSFPLFLVAEFMIGFGSAADISLSTLMLLMVVPTSSRSAAVALSRLISGIFVTPAAQLIGMVSDAFRGNSTLPYDRFHAYQMALLCSVSFSFGAAVCDFILIFFFKQDCERADQKTKEEEAIVDENTNLLGAPHLRVESMETTVVRSRASTVAEYSL